MRQLPKAASGFTAMLKTGFALTLCLSTVGATVALAGVGPATAAAPALAPTVTSVSPASGPIIGGNRVTIKGSNLTGATVNFGANNPVSPLVDTPAELVVGAAPAPPTSCASTFPCTVDITVTTSGGTSATSPADEFTYEDAPTVTSLHGGNAPVSGGTTIVVQGTNLAGASTVDFDQTPAVSVTPISSSLLSVVTPPIESGINAAQIVNVTVVTGAGTSATSTASNFYWFGSGSCAFSGTGVVNGGGPPGSSAYITGATEGQQGTTGTVTRGSTDLTDPSADFTSADVGAALIVISPAVTASGQSTTVAAVVSSTELTMANASIASLSGNAIYIIGQGVQTNCTGLSGLALTSPFIESLASPMSPVVTGTGPGGNGGNEVWLGWSGENNYFSTGLTSASDYTAPGPDGYVLPYSGTNTSGGCPVAPTLCPSAGGEGTNPYYGTDPQAQCPPTQAETDAGFVTCALSTIAATASATSSSSYIASSLYLSYKNAPTPDAPTATLTPDPKSGLTPNETVTVNSCDTCNWWGSGQEGSPGFVDPSGPTGVAAAVPAPAIWIGATRDSAVEATDSTVTITPGSYDCGSSGGSAANPPGPVATCTLAQGTISGTFSTPSTLPCTTCNVYIDEPNLTLLQGEYSGSSAYNVGLTYNLVNAVEAVVPGGTPPPQPTVTGVSPTSGSTAGGTSVTITGTNLSGATAVNFGSGNPGTVVSSTATSVTATSPSGTGTVDVRVTTPNGTSAANPPDDQFTYVAPTLPAVTGVSPTSGSTAGGTSVTITGTNLSGATAVDFGTGNPGTVVSSSATSVSATSPPGAAGAVDVTVTTPNGTSPANPPDDQFTYVNANGPTVTSLSPTSGPSTGGTSVTITGTNLSGATAVDFGTGNPGTVVSSTATSVSATSPPGTGTVPVTVTTPNGTSPVNTGAEFTYTTPGPTVTGLSPSTGSTAGGTSVTITGTSLSGATVVDFGPRRPGTIVSDSDTSITATSPAGTGTVDVTVTTPSGTSPANPPADQFTYAIPVPTVTGVSPSSGPAAGGNTVTVNGTNLSGATAVDFGTGKAGTIVTDTDTSVTAMPPAGSGTVDVTVTTTAGGTSAVNAPADQYTYVPAPTVSSVSPTSGPAGGGTSVTISGTNLGGATAVDFGSNNPGTITAGSATSVTATSPAGSGTVDVSVTTAGGTSAANPPGDHFTYVAPPTVTTATLPGGTVGTAYNQTLAATAGTTPYTWSISSGALPAGLTLNSGTGAITGSPTTAGTATFSAKVTDATGASGTASLSIAVSAVPPTAPSGSTGSASNTGSSPTGTVSATQGNVTGSGQGPGSVTVATYGSNPTGATISDGTGAFYDVAIGAGSAFSSLTITICNPGAGTALDWFNGTAWVAFSNQSVQNGCIVATVTASTSPTLSQLNGTPVAVVAQAAPAAATGYWLFASDGGIFAFGNAGFYGSLAGLPLGSGVVSMSPTPDKKGYWFATSTGSVFAFGDAKYYGGANAFKPTSPIVSMASTADGKGYWEVASDGGIFSFGDAKFFGSQGGQPLNSPIEGFTATADGQGYWEVASDGGIFSFGDAKFFGSMGGTHLNKPIVGMTAAPDGGGYWLVASDGGIFSFGDAKFYGSMGGQPLNSPIEGISATADGKGYWEVASDGGIFSFGDAKFFGSMGGKKLNEPIAGMAAS